MITNQKKPVDATKQATGQTAQTFSTGHKREYSVNWSKAFYLKFFFPRIFFLPYLDQGFKNRWSIITVQIIKVPEETLWLVILGYLNKWTLLDYYAKDSKYYMFDLLKKLDLQCWELNL